MGKSGFIILVFVALLIALLFTSTQIENPPANDNRRSFSSTDAFRNGTKALKEVLPLLFTASDIKTARTSFYRYEKENQLVYETSYNNEDSTTAISDSIPGAADSLLSTIDTNQYIGTDTNDWIPDYSYIVVEDDITFNQTDIKRLFTFVAQGNTVLIASPMVPLGISDSFYIQTSYNLLNLLDSSKTSHSLQLYNKNIKYPKDYFLKGKRSSSYYETFDSSRASIIATLDKNKAVALSINYGQGKFIITTLQDLFLNQNIVKQAERNVTYTLLNYANAYTVIWDEYYKKYNPKNRSTIAFIKNNKSLYALFICLLIGIIVYMVFESKRRQREIKIISEKENSTLNFVHAITALYRKNSSSHQDIIKQKILHWYDLLKNKIRIDTQKLHIPNERLLLSEKTGIPFDKINEICNQIKYLEVAHEISHKELAEFDNYMLLFEKFN